ncbi:hypothetical protein [uncultured Anaerococcus sp.]|uniref:hypothetical protein n=1 Tax=uncultured Anaerococcus sp. TaxID=293428 RepID=UPI0028891324|nr:hypothetical protein [uncultured Anaerococcus sp.]
MRSIIKMVGILILFIFPPLFVNCFLIGFDIYGESAMFISQIGIIGISLVVILLYLRGKRLYEAKTLMLIDGAKSIEDLEKLRDKRITYDSKAAITKAILLRDFSEKEAEKLKKYTNKVADMEHYYSGLIKNADPSLREEYKVRRDNFNKKYKHKSLVYSDFKENLRMSLKWLGGFFLILIGTGLVQKFTTIKDLYVFAYIFQMVFGLGFMINTIIWLSRTLKSYWDKDYI